MDNEHTILIKSRTLFYQNWKHFLPQELKGGGGVCGLPESVRGCEGTPRPPLCPPFGFTGCPTKHMTFKK